MNECEYCAQPTSARRVIEQPSDDEAKSLSSLFWVIDPNRLVFCDAECRQKWHGLRRRALWDKHPPTCTCVTCLG